MLWLKPLRNKGVIAIVEQVMPKPHRSSQRGGHQNTGLEDQRRMAANAAERQAVTLQGFHGGATQHQKRLNNWARAASEYEDKLFAKRLVVHAFEPMGHGFNSCDRCGAGPNDEIDGHLIHAGETTKGKGDVPDEWKSSLEASGRKLRKIQAAEAQARIEIVTDAKKAMAAGASLAAVAREVGIPATQLQYWINVTRVSGETAYRGRGRPRNTDFRQDQ